MCGIAGAVGLEPGVRPAPERVRAISALLCHRGPDGEGLWTSADERAVLAHRRLSVIDLETGGQPMPAGGMDAAIVFNGEIYNYVELRDAGMRRGRRYRTTSDTEVLLQALVEEGPPALAATRGMFAFAFWNGAAEALLLARDRLGKKPLYYSVEDGCLWFSSSLRSLRLTSPRRWATDAAAIDDYLSLGYVPAPRTAYREARKLEPASILTLDRRGLGTARFWDLAVEDPPFEGSFEDAVDALEERLDTAVRIRLRSDVPLGVFLSGGIDSSLVAAIAARSSRAPVQTFSIGFDRAAFDESGFAARVAAHLGTEHREFRVHADVLDLVPRLVDHFGEPFADSSAIPVWTLAEHARKHVTVALGGDGGDEGFAGYPWYRTARTLARLSALVPGRAAALGSRLLGGDTGARQGPRAAARAGRGLSMLAVAGDGPRFAALRSFVNRAEAGLLYAGDLRDARAGAEGRAVRELAELHDRCEGGLLRRMRYVDLQRYLADGLNVKVDVATMAHGLEARAPLLDQEVVRFAMALPERLLVDSHGGKRLLRALLARHVPRPLFERPKQGFSLPLAPWFARELRPRVEGLAASEALRATGWLRPQGIARLVAEHAAGHRDHSQRIFSLLMLDEWLKRCA